VRASSAGHEKQLKIVRQNGLSEAASPVVIQLQGALTPIKSIQSAAMQHVGKN
jgi:hypothetical protein